MQKRQFGNSKQSVPLIGQGSWQFDNTPDGRKAAIKALQSGIELGMTHIDTAEMYGTEEIIGEAISAINREEIFLVSKVLPSNASYKGTIAACEKSLKRLRTDYLDCYLLHWRGSIALSETFKGLEKLIDDGKIRAMGVSNFDVDDIEEARSLANKPIACNQILYNLYTRGPERKLMPMCAKENIAIVAYTPFGRKRMPARGTERGDTLHAIADKHKATVAQIILAFVVRDKNVFTIPKASSEQHVIENAAAGKLKLTEDEIRRIDALFPAPNHDIPLETL